MDLTLKPNFTLMKGFKAGNKFKQGADPEFALVDSSGRAVEGRNFCHDSARDKFGTDGNSHTMELRPEPSNSPFQIVKDLRETMLRQVAEFPELLDYKWLAGSFAGNVTLGGHIHFEVPSGGGRFDPSRFDTENVCYILSQYCGPISLLLDNKKDFLNRRNGSYGRIMDCRVDKPYGFEYRTLSSWLNSPYFAIGFLCLSRAVMYEIYNQNYEFFQNKCLIDGMGFHECNREKARRALDKIYEDIQNFRLYKNPKTNFKPYIDILYKLINDRKSWCFNEKETPDMKASWGIGRSDLDFSTQEVTLDAIFSNFQ